MRSRRRCSSHPSCEHRGLEQTRNHLKHRAWCTWVTGMNSKQGYVLMQEILLLEIYFSVSSYYLLHLIEQIFIESLLCHCAEGTNMVHVLMWSRTVMRNLPISRSFQYRVVSQCWNMPFGVNKLGLLSHFHLRFFFFFFLPVSLLIWISGSARLLLSGGREMVWRPEVWWEPGSWRKP